jgi:hypothetical protein
MNIDSFDYEVHPLEDIFKGCGAFYLKCKNEPYYLGQVIEFITIDKGLDLFTKRHKAEKFLKEVQEDNPNEVFEIAFAENRELLMMVVNCHYLEIDTRPFCTSIGGLFIAQDSTKEKVELSSLEEVRDALILEKSA